MSTRFGPVKFGTPEEKAAWLDVMASLDARIPIVRQMAGRVARGRDPNRLDLVAADLQRLVRDGIRYVRDPGAEEFADSGVILRRGFGDCDDKARLFVALCRACGVTARTRPVFFGPAFVHVQAETQYPGSERHPEAQPGGWLVVELILRDVGVGDDPNAARRLPDGRRILS